MTLIIKCLKEGVWPEDKFIARTLRMKINQYVLEGGVIFKKSYMVPMLRSRSVVAKAIRQGYYWPTMHRDARNEIQKFMPNSCSDTKASKDADDVNHGSVVVLSMGDRHLGSPTSIRWEGEVFSTWMSFGGNTRNLGSFREETDKITDLHQILEDVLLIERGDGVASIKRRRRDLFCDDVWNLEMASGRGRLKEDLESST
ncbi:hypothetical protein Tco_1188629 [Tanacetum coccineum]